MAIFGKGRYYLLLDDIQEVKDWEKAVNSLLEGADVDIYVTGSDSKLMASEIFTYLTGRYVSIPVYTLSFREYLDFKADSTLSHKELLEKYILSGGFPIIALTDYEEQVGLPECQRDLSHGGLTGHCEAAQNQQTGFI